MYYTYVLFCHDTSRDRHKFYIGSTENLKERLDQHRSKNVQTTKSFDKIQFVYCEICLNKADALKRENQLKTGFGRGYLKRRLESYFKVNEVVR